MPIGSDGLFEAKLLDAGYLKEIEVWGSDQRIIESARMSTAKGFLGWDPGPCPVCEGRGTVGISAMFQPCLSCEGKGQIIGDARLLKRLWTLGHSTPFEMAGITVEVKAPIMVFREWHRHRVPFGYAEMSARYVPLPDEHYVPTVDRLMKRGGANKQAQSTGSALHEQDAIAWLAQLAEVYEHAEQVYKLGLAMGVPKELARLPVPVGRYSAMRATGNLRGWLGFLKLRAAESAQEEIRVYAHAVGELVKRRFPRTYEVAAESVGLSL